MTFEIQFLPLQYNVLVGIEPFNTWAIVVVVVRLAASAADSAFVCPFSGHSVAELVLVSTIIEVGVNNDKDSLRISAWGGIRQETVRIGFQLRIECPSKHPGPKCGVCTHIKSKYVERYIS